MLKKLLGSVREYKKHTILSPIFMILEVVMQVIIPLYLAKLIDNGINIGDMGYVLKMGGILAILCALALIFGVLCGSYASSASAGFAKNLRKDMYYNIQNFSFSSIDKFSAPSIITRLTTDVTNVQNSFQMLIRVAIRSPIMLISSILMSFMINAKIASIFLFGMLFLSLGLALIIKYAYPIFRKIFKIYDKLNGVVQENLHAVRVVKSFVREDFEEEKFKNVSNNMYKKYITSETIVALNTPLMQFVMYLCMLALAWFGAKMIVSQEMSVGSLTILVTYTMQMLMSLMMLSMILVMLTMSRASGERIVEILEEKTDIKNCENPIFEIKNADLTFKNVNFSYTKEEDKLCLKNININIKEGETIGILGPTGSGKSSLVQLIPRLYDTFSGEVLIGGKNVKEYNLETLRNSVSMVLQKNTLFSGTIKENLKWGNENATDEEIIKACKLAQADSFIQEFPEKYDTFVEQGGQNLSGGQRQRLCIARAILKNPKILILDDSTSAVDTKTDSLIREAFKKEIPNTTKIIIAQRISSIEFCDKIIVLDEGKITGFDTHKNLLENNNLYKEIFELQQKGGFSDEL